MSRILDARGLRCPWPVLRLARAMADADDITIMADDPAVPEEIAALAHARGWSSHRLAGNNIRIYKYSR